MLVHPGHWGMDALASMLYFVEIQWLHVHRIGVCGYGYGYEYGWEISYPRQACPLYEKLIIFVLVHKDSTAIEAAISNKYPATHSV